MIEALSPYYTETEKFRELFLFLTFFKCPAVFKS